MRQATHFILKLHLLLFPFYSSPHLHAVIASPPSPRPSPNNNNNSELNNDDIEAIAAAAQKAEALRARLQSHVEAQVNKILSEKHSQNSQNINNNNNGQKLELKIDLPPDLAALVNNEGGAALKIHQFGLHRKEESDMEEVTVTLDTSSPTSTTTPKTIKKKKDPLADVAKVADIIKSAEAAAKAKSASAKNDVEASSETPCDLGTHSETGFGKDGKCEVCPEGLTTRKVGSSECEVVTEEDMLAMFFDSMGGQKWSEHQRRGWKSDLPACQWGGVSCDADGRIIGIAFPEFLGMPMVKI
mmetsp:Transcript_37047/g.79989  ORF Transcript_37047/g.79989 Transcript_37047/m.79989 type:complete len:300 (-) Transcript_37047:16-915(-)